MEQIIVSSNVNGQTYRSGIEQHGTAYEEFMRWRPNYQALGNAWFEIFADAVRSLLLNTESVSKVGINEEKVANIITAACRYASLYHQSEDGDRALYILRGVLDDVIRGYEYRDHKYDSIVEKLYQRIVDLITV